MTQSRGARPFWDFTSRCHRIDKRNKRDRWTNQSGLHTACGLSSVCMLGGKCILRISAAGQGVAKPFLASSTKRPRRIPSRTLGDHLTGHALESFQNVLIAFLIWELDDKLPRSKMMCLHAYMYKYSSSPARWGSLDSNEDFYEQCDSWHSGHARTRSPQGAPAPEPYGELQISLCTHGPKHMPERMSEYLLDKTPECCLTGCQRECQIFCQVEC